jgi:hypothetical protein
MLGHNRPKDGIASFPYARAVTSSLSRGDAWMAGSSPAMTTEEILERPQYSNRNFRLRLRLAFAVLRDPVERLGKTLQREGVGRLSSFG